MNIKLLCFFTILLFGCSAYGQAPVWQWAKEANSSQSEQAWDIAYDNFSGNLYVGGTFNGNLSAVYGASLSSTYGQSDGFVAKYDPLGNVLWAFKIGGSNAEEVKSIATDDLGNVYVTGYFKSVCDFDPSGSTFNLTPSGGAGSQDGFLAKYDALGNFTWATKFGNSSAENVWRMYVDANGIYLTGSYIGNITFNSASPSVVTKTTTANQGMGDDEFFGAKYDVSGVVQWVVSGASQKDDVGFDVVADNNNVYFIGDYNKDIDFYNANGTFTAQLLVGNNNNSSAFIVCYNQSGAFNWATSMGSSSSVNAHGGGITQDNLNVYITGSFAGTVGFPVTSPLFSKVSAGSNDIYLAKISKSSGIYQWVSPQTGIGTGDETAYEAVCDAAGNIIIAGYFSSSITFTNGTTFSTLGNQDVLVSCFNNAGNFLWATRAGANNNEVPYGLATSTTGGIYVAGSHENATVFGAYTLTSAGGTNIFVAKTGCETASNNTIAVSQTICTGNTPSSLSGSLPVGGNFVYKWEQSANNGTWTPAIGTNTNQNFSPPPLSNTTYYRRNVLAGYSCTNDSKSNTVTVNVSPNPALAIAGFSQAICINTPTTLLAGNVPTVGIGTWSVMSGSGSIVTPTLATSGLLNLGAGNNVLRWSISSSPCTASSATVLIRVDNLPGPASVGVNQTICSSTAVLSASSLTAGTGLWSLVAGTGTLSGSCVLTPTVSGIGTGTNSLLWTVSNGVCPSSTAAVSIYRDAFPVANAGSNQTICATGSTLAAITQTFGSGVWSVVAGTSTVSNLISASPNVSGVSTGTNTYVWTVSNGVCPSSTAAVSIYRDAFPIANAGSDQMICAVTSTLAAITQTFGSGVWSVVAGTSTVSNLISASPNVSGISTGTNTYVWTVSNGVCPSSTAAVSIYRDAFPIANAGSNQTICAVTSTLAAITQTFGSGVWSVVAGTSTVSNLISASPNVSGVSTGTNTYVWTVSNGVCPSSTAAVSIYRDAFPIANAGSNQTICAVTSTLAAITQTFGSGVWSVVAGTSTVSNLISASPNVSGVSTGTNTYVWTVSNGVCPSSTAAVSIYRDAFPIANAGSNQTICAVTSTLAAITQTFGSGVWSVVAGTSTVSNLISASPNVSGVSTGTNTYVWTVSNGVCPSSTAAVSIYRDAFPIANAGSDQTICAVTSTLAAIAQTFGSGVWSVVAGTSTVSNLISASPNVSGISTGTNTYVWTVSNGVCPSSTAAVSIYRDAFPIANAGSNQTICALTSTLAAITQTFGSGVWSVVAGTSTLSNLISASPNVSGVSTGTNTYVWTVSNGVCPSSTAAVSIYRDAFPIANAGSNQTICAVTSTLAAITQTFGSGVWSVVAGTSTVSNLISASPNVSGISTGTNTYVWTVSNGVCPSSTAAVSIYRDAFPIANAGSNQTICATGSTLAAITQTFGSGVWSVVAGTSTLSNLISASPNVSGVSTGTNTYVWTVSNGVCPSSTAAVSIYRDAFPIANAGSDQTVCSSTAVLAAITQSFGIAQWSVTAGTSSLSAPNSPSSTVTGLVTGTNSYVWTVSNGVCPSATAAVSIMRDNLGTAANAGTIQVICSSSAVLTASAVTVGSGMWTTAGPAIISSPTSSTTAVSGLVAGPNTFSWTVVNGVCPASTATVAISRDLPPLSANAGGDQTICSSTITIGASPPAIGNGTWTTISGPAIVTSSTSATSLVSGIIPGTNTFKWTVVNGVCPSATAIVNVFHDIPPISNAGTNQTVCASQATLGAILQTLGTGTWSMLTVGGSFASTTSATTIVSALNTGSNSILWLFANGVCPNAYDTVEIFREPAPLANAGVGQTICTNVATLAAITQTFGTGSWSVTAGTSTLSSLVSPTTNASGISTGTNTYVWTVTYAVCPLVSGTVTIIRDQAPSANAGTDQTVCAVGSTLSAITQTFGTGVWSVLAGTSTLSAQNSPAVSVSGIGNGTNTYLWSVSNGVCPSSTAAVSIYRDAFPIANAGTDQTVCAVTSTLAAVTQTFGAGVWSVTAGTSTLSNLSSAFPNVSGISTGANTYLWTVSNGVCPTATAMVSIYRDEYPIANAGSNQTVCALSASLSAVTQTFGTGAWSVLSGSASISATVTPSTTVSGMSSGSNIFQWTVTNGVCAASISTVSVTRDVMPFANAGNSQTVCAATASLSALLPSIGNGTWSVIGGGSVVNNLNSASAAVSGIATGTNSFLWSVSNGVCPVSTATVFILRDQFPSISDAGSNQVICSTTATLNAVAPTIGNGLWSVKEGTGGFANLNLPSTNIAGLNTGINTFLWTVSNGVCIPSRDSVSIKVDAMPTPAFADNDQAVCSSTFVMNANKPDIGSSSWKVISGSASVSDSTSNKASIGSLAVGINVLRWSIKNGTCPVSSDEIIITRDAVPSVAVAGLDQKVDKPIAQVSAEAPIVGKGSWSIQEGLGKIDDPLNPVANIAGLAIGNNLVRWAVVNGVCPASNSDIIIFVDNLRIPDGFSPNGDGINDTYVVPGMDYYDNVDFSVFNRWGGLVYQNNDYKNDWNGTNLNDGLLADDTYYYVIKISADMKYNGYLIIKAAK